MNLATLYTVGQIALGVLAGAIVALKYIAPRTVTTVDDNVLARLEALEALVEKLVPQENRPQMAPADSASK